jgi:hypothetical protein
MATTWYVNGVSGSDRNNCTLPSIACKSIGHAVALASSGDSIVVAPATYTESVTISISLTVIGSGASKTLIDGGGNSRGIGHVGTAASHESEVIPESLRIELAVMLDYLNWILLQLEPM